MWDGGVPGHPTGRVPVCRSPLPKFVGARLGEGGLGRVRRREKRLMLRYLSLMTELWVGGGGGGKYKPTKDRPPDGGTCWLQSATPK